MHWAAADAAETMAGLPMTAPGCARPNGGPAGLTPTAGMPLALGPPMPLYWCCCCWKLWLVPAPGGGLEGPLALPWKPTFMPEVDIMAVGCRPGNMKL